MIDKIKADNEEHPECPKEVLLVTTKTCPNCKIAKAMLDKAGVEYTVVDAEEDRALTAKYGVSQAPTLVVVDCDNVEQYINASNRKKFAEGKSQAVCMMLLS